MKGRRRVKMPTNIEIQNKKCREYIAGRLLALKDLPEGMTMSTLIRDTTLTFPVSSGFVKRFVQECFIDDKIVRLVDGVLFYNIKGE